MQEAILRFQFEAKNKAFQEVRRCDFGVKSPHAVNSLETPVYKTDTK